MAIFLFVRGAKSGEEQFGEMNFLNVIIRKPYIGYGLRMDTMLV